MGRKEYYIDSDNPDTVLWGMSWRAIILTIVAVLLCGGIGWAGWAVKVATSEVKGAGDAQIEINSGDNRIQSQELFQELHAKILEYDKNLDVAAAAFKRNPSTFNATNLDGLIMACNEAVTQYNAETRKVSRGRWLSTDLPYEIPVNDERYDCKESGQ